MSHMADSNDPGPQYGFVEGPPAYQEPADADGAVLASQTKVRDDGRIDLDLDLKLTRRLSKLLIVPPNLISDAVQYSDAERRPWTIKLNIVIQVVGSRGDVQPFIAFGNELQKHGHRVRIATHDQFENFVRQSNLEFYPIGGDPAELMAYMVKNPGLIPSMKTLKGGEIQRKRFMVAEMLDGCWKSCINADTKSGDPFVADVIIANPPSFAHIHCAQALGIPLHLCFTMPWSPTKAFSHPLANLKNSSVDVETGNYLSYLLVEWMTWQGIGDLVNKFRESIDLAPIPYSEGPTLATSLKVPFTYCWSPALVPKPLDWPSHIDVCGFFFRDMPNYTPPPDLDAFLQKPGPPIVYIGFGSIVIDDPQSLTNMLLEAVHALGVRAIISRGWSKLGGAQLDHIFYLDDCPHEWLFQHVSAVVHHGGAGTAACGLRNGRPTMIVPFFGDQPFWGEMVNTAGAGPAPVPHTALNAKNLAEGIAHCLTESAAFAAKAIADKMNVEDGVKAAVRSFHRNLPLENLRCDLLPDQPGAWRYKSRGRKIKLSKLAAELLIRNKRLDPEDLKLLETNPIDIENRRWEPVSAMTSAYIGTATDIVSAHVTMYTGPYEEYKKAQVQGSKSKTSIPSEGTQRPGTPDIDQNLSQRDGDGSSASSIHSVKKHRMSLQTAGAMATASGKGLGQTIVAAAKGALVDVPLATAEGMRAIPRLYGDDVRDYGRVKGVKSGMIVGGKALGLGMVDGLTDFVMQPYKGGKEEGTLGVVKGVGKGVAGLVSKIAGGAMGFWAYPAQGIAKSISKAVNTTRKTQTESAKSEEGAWLIEKGLANNMDVLALLVAFDVLRANRQ